MVFSSVLFIFRFLPVAFLIYYLAPQKLKNTVLLLASLFFYSWGEARYFPIMLSVILVNYLAALGMDKFRDNKLVCKGLFLFGVLYDLGMLGFFKYTNFILGNINAILPVDLPMMPQITLPLGISFYTFQILSYTIDVYLEKVPPERNIIDFGAFVVLFPQLIAGPIVKYTDINHELKHRVIDLERVQSGVKLFIFGVASKVLIADNVGYLWTEVEALGFANISTPLAWLAILAYSFQIYFDFSGYSLMAIGLGRMMGFEFPKNFDFPYISRSITEFWRRWHITLSSWFREYLYFPLGGSRRSPARNTLNLLIVWAATGLWHGASWNFVLWGLFFFVLLTVERFGLKKFLDRHRIFSHIYTLFFIVMGWTLFVNTDFAQLGLFLSRLFAFDGGTDWIYYLRNYAASLVLAGVVSTPLLKPLFEKLDKNKVFSVVFFGAMFALCVAYMVDSTYSPFLYFNF